VAIAVAVALLFSGVIALAAAFMIWRGDSIPRDFLALLFSVALARTAVAVWRGNSSAAWLMVALGVVSAVIYLSKIAALTIVATSLVAAVQLHARRQTPSAALLMRWWGWSRVMIGAALPKHLDVIAFALGVAWLIGLAVAGFGPSGAVALVVWVGIGVGEIALMVFLAARFIRWVRGKR